MANSSVEKQLRIYWRQFLYLDNFGIHDSFFELGGDELLFEGLLYKLQQNFGLNISHLNRANFSTLYQQESFINKHLNILPNSIVIPLQKGKENINHPTIVTIHPVGGSLFSFMPLITKMQSNNKIYGIQDVILTGDKRQFQSTTEQANFYITELKKEITPGTKIILMGYSSGGVIANEMAYQLFQQEEIEIQHVVLFDSWTRTPSSISFRDNIPSIIKRNFDKLKPFSFFQTQEEIDYWLYDVIWNRMKAVFLHKPKPMNVNTTIFVPIESVPEYSVDKEMVEDWAQLVRHLDIHYVKGNHENMLEGPDLTSIIKILQPIFNPMGMVEK